MVKFCFNFFLNLKLGTNNYMYYCNGTWLLFQRMEILCLNQSIFVIFAWCFSIIERFLSCGQHTCKFTEIKGSVYVRKEFNSQGTGLVHQHGRYFIVLEHQYGCRDVMWKRSIVLYSVWLSGRVWIYIAFSDGLLESYIRLFLDGQKLAKKFYTRWELALISYN